MTEKLYYNDSHLAAFESTVENILQREGRYAVVLASTAFFPTGGGQPCDVGRIGDASVVQVEEEDGIIWHYCASAPGVSVGDTVSCEIDYSLRFARMQAHSGEHIVSGAAHGLFGAQNVGFHMDGLLMTVDFDLPLTKEQIDRIEARANEFVYADVPVEAHIYTKEEAAGIDYRSKKEFAGDVRIVTIGDMDRCACCAPHVTRTGEIGLIKILSCVSHRGGVRITLICGREAYGDYCSKYRQTLRIASLLAAKHDETDQAVEALIEQNKALKNAVFEQKRRLCAYIVSRMEPTEGNAVLFAPGCDMDELGEIAAGMAEKCCGVCVACAGTDETGYSYAALCRGEEMSRYAKTINAALNGRGGGRGEMIRGSFRAARADIEQYFRIFEVTEI